MKQKNSNVEFGNRLDDLIRQKDLTKSKIADICGLARASLTHYVYGNRSPSLENFMRIADAAGFTNGDILFLLGAFKDTDELSDEIQHVGYDDEQCGRTK